jgi:hypothetical protein
LYDSEIFAILIDQLSKPEVTGAVIKPVSLLFADGTANETTEAPTPSPIGAPSMLRRLMRKEGAFERASLVAKHLAKWEDQNGIQGAVVLQPAHIAGADGSLGDKSKLQFALARMFILRAGLPPASHSMEWTRQYEHLQLGLTNLRSQANGIRAQRRGWCSVRQDATPTATLFDPQVVSHFHCLCQTS